MPQNQSGTLEVIAIELAKVVEPLEERIKSGEILLLFAELGVRLPDALAADPNFQSGLTDAIDRLEVIPGLIKALVEQIEAEDYSAAAGTAFDLTEAIVHLIVDIDKIADAIEAAPAFPAADAGDFVANLSRNLIDYLLVNYVESVAPAAAAVLEFLAIVERSPQNVGSTNPVLPPYTKKALHIDNLTSAFSNPLEHLRTLYGWGNDDFDGAALLEKLNKIMLALGLPVLLDTSVTPNRLNILFFELSAKTDVTPPALQLLLKYIFTVGGTYQLVRDGWHAELGVQAQIPLEAGIVLEPDLNVEIIPPAAGTIQGEVFGRWTAVPQAGQTKIILLGQEGAGRVEMAELRTEARVNLKWDGTSATSELIIEAQLTGGSIVVDATKGDGFLSKILPGTRIQADFDILMGVSSQRGFYFQGSSALEIRLPVHIEIGPIALEGLTLTLKIAQNQSTGVMELPISLGADIKVALGPLVAVVQNMGLTAKFSFPRDNSGNLGGSTQLDFAFKPPNGVGLSIEAGGIKGAGFLYLDFDKGEYIGALELEFQSLFSLKAIGLINTKLPDGSNGFALLIIIVAEFSPIQLGYGFSLNGVGGLLGLNRTVRIEVLRSGVKTGALNSVLFPQDVVANITRIVSDLKQIFPIEVNHFLIGPMAKIGWGNSILTLELGLLLDIPRPMFAILGVLRLALPDEDAPVLKLQVNFLGVVDFENKYISFDASLYDSNLLIFTLTGDMALRISWGAQAVFILSVGGFHPDFHDAPADLQEMKRLGISLLSGDNPRVSIMCYFAVTSNTVQIGAKAELYAEAAGFNIHGYLGFDVLFQFDPFRFIAEIYAGIALRRKTSTIMSLRLRGSLSGPKPWDVEGSASFSILFFDVTIRFHETWGDLAELLDKIRENIKALLLAQLNDDRNWRAAIPDNNHLHVTVKKIETGDGSIVIHPFGTLTFSQSQVPLNYTLDKFGERLPLDDTRFALTNVHSGTTQLPNVPVKDRFAPAQYTQMSDSKKLSTPSFQMLDSGFELTGTANVTTPPPVSKNVDYEVSYLRDDEPVFAGTRSLAKSRFNMARRASAVANASISYKNTKLSDLAPSAVVTEPEEYVVANVSDMRPYAAGVTVGSYAEAQQRHDALIASNPELKGQLQVLSTLELNDL